MPSPYVFLSYSRHDGAFVARLAADLRTKGLEVWSDPQDEAAPAAPAERAAAFERAQTVLFVASPLSVAAPEVLAELERALAAKRRVVPLSLEPLGDALPLGLARAPGVDFCGGYGLALDRLCALLSAPATRATPTHAYYAYGPAPDPNAFSTFPESASSERAARAHTPFPYVPQGYEQPRAGHSLDPVNAFPHSQQRSRSSVAVSTACLAVAASVVAFVALVGGSTKTERLGTGTPLPELHGATVTGAAASLRPSEDWLGTWRSGCASGPYGASTWTTLTVEPTRLVAEVSDCVTDPPSVLRFEWRLDATRSRGNGLHELEMHFERLQALPRRTAFDWNASGRFGRRNWVDGVPAEIAPTSASPAFALKPGDARHELATLRGDTLSLAASLSLALVNPAGARAAGSDPSERFTRLGR